MKAAIIQARCSSTRYPSKVFAALAGKPLIWHVVNRLTYCKKIDKIIIATTINPNDDPIVDWGKQENIAVYRGDENNVLNRYYSAAKAIGLKVNDIVIRITADDPFKEPAIIDKVIGIVEKREADFACNNNPPTFPEGLDCEVFTMNVLEKAEKSSADTFEREHVTPFMHRHPHLIKSKNVSLDKNLSYLRFTLDTPADYRMIQTVYDYLYRDDRIFVLNDILELFKKYPEIQDINSNEVRSALYQNNNPQ